MKKRCVSKPFMTLQRLDCTKFSLVCSYGSLCSEQLAHQVPPVVNAYTSTRSSIGHANVQYHTASNTTDSTTNKMLSSCKHGHSCGSNIHPPRSKQHPQAHNSYTGDNRVIDTAIPVAILNDATYAARLECNRTRIKFEATAGASLASGRKSPFQLDRTVRLIHSTSAMTNRARQAAGTVSPIYRDHGVMPISISSRSCSNGTKVGSVGYPLPAAAEFTSKLEFIPEAAASPIPCYRVIDHAGQNVNTIQTDMVDKELAIQMYEKMAVLQVMDSVFYDAQRQGRFSFYMTTAGEEAVNIGCAAGLQPVDHIFSQYRESGVLLWRGFSLSQFAGQCFGNENDAGKGRQMPVHYGSASLLFHTISSPLATQLPHAVGMAYALKMSNQDCCSVAFFGDGAASEGDFHAALNFASVLEVPVLFICRNNGWAISTPTHEQYRGDGIASRGQAYGMKSLRVDGNDALAVFSAVREARELIIHNKKPILLEMMTYRVGHHSTSDDSSRYRQLAEINLWKMQRDPVARFRKWIQERGWWGDEEEEALKKGARREVIEALVEAEKVAKPPLSELFTDVYDKIPPNLIEQEGMVRETIINRLDEYPQDVPLD